MTNTQHIRNRPILISAGGTGGGVYPAVAVAEALHQATPERPLHFVGSTGGMERQIVPHELFTAYHEVYAGPLNGVGLLRALSSLIKLLIGTLQAWALAGQVRPALLFLTGGWATFPAALGCWLRRIPIVIFLPDIEPALAIQWMSRISQLILATTADSASYFKPGIQVLEIGYPLRADVANATRAEGQQHFKIDPACKTLLVFGGSRGARTLNNVLAAILPQLIADGVQVIHISGELDWPTVQARAAQLPDDIKAHYRPFAYLHGAEMGMAFASADLVVSRAGASSLGELPHFGLPAILVPYPYAWRFQKVNAEWLASRGAAQMLTNDAVADQMLPTIQAFLNDPAKLEATRNAARQLAREDVAGAIARKLIELAGA